MKSKALLFTRVEGGVMQIAPFDIYDDMISDYTIKDVEVKEVFNKLLKQTIKTRVIKIGKVFVKALFFDNGLVYDVGLNGFGVREGYEANEHIHNIYNQKNR